MQGASLSSFTTVSRCCTATCFSFARIVPLNAVRNHSFMHSDPCTPSQEDLSKFGEKHDVMVCTMLLHQCLEHYLMRGIDYTCRSRNHFHGMQQYDAGLDVDLIMLARGTGMRIAAQCARPRLEHATIASNSAIFTHTIYSDHLQSLPDIGAMNFKVSHSFREGIEKDLRRKEMKVCDAGSHYQKLRGSDVQVCVTEDCTHVPLHENSTSPTTISHPLAAFLLPHTHPPLCPHPATAPLPAEPFQHLDMQPLLRYFSCPRMC